MNQPYMTLDHLDPDPPDEVFRKMGSTREQYVAPVCVPGGSAGEAVWHCCERKLPRHDQSAGGLPQ